VFTQALGSSTTGFEGEFRFEADIQGLATSVGRHPSANLLPIFNSSYRRLRELVVSYGYTQFCVRGTTTALPVAAVEAGETYASITTLVAMDQLKMLDVKDTTGRWRTLPEVTLLQLRDFATTTRGQPQAWCWLDAGTVSAATFTGGRIAITPVPNGGSYALWTMPETTPVVQTTDVFLYHTEDWRMWHMYDVMSRVCGARDKDTARKLDFIMSRLDPDVEGSPAFNIRNQAPTAAGSKTMTRASNYRGIGGLWGR
jgi:mRNA-degrading endonuclease toxin of MazEF toxin-antitoxin module